MKIKHYSFKSFIISEGNTKIAIDPGQNLGGLSVSGVKVHHGPLPVKMAGIRQKYIYLT